MKLSINKSRKLWWLISSVVILVGVVAMVISWQNPAIRLPLRPGLDFIGGTRLQFERDCTKPGNCDTPIDINSIRDIAKAQGLGDSSIQVIENNGLSVRTKNLDVEPRSQFQKAIVEKMGVVDPQKTQIDTVGPTFGQQLFIKGVIALVLSFLGIVIYLTFRFQLDYAILAIIALLHDVLVTVGIFAILGLVFGTEVDSLFIVALLTITGFSVNDTVVIYDRIRETLTVNGDRPFSDIVDDAVNQTLGRSINTTLTTLLSLVAIFLFGGETLRNFALALIIGFAMGAYSSIFIASTLLVWWRERQGAGKLTTTADSSQ